MVRPLRQHVEGGWYHVFGRGWERRRIFVDDGDREHFLELLAGLMEKYRVEVHAYVLMDNHHHLIVRTPDANLSAAMQWFNTSYSAWFNARHQRVGSLWQGRYRDVRVEDGRWAYELSVYVHLNPLRVAGLGLDKHGRVLEGRGYRVPTREQATERLRRLRTYRWSSYRAYAGYCAPPEWLTTEALLARAGDAATDPAACYRRYVRQRLTQGVDPERHERLRDALAIGSGAFVREVRERAWISDPEATLRAEFRKRVREQDLRHAVEDLRGEPFPAWAHRRGDWARPLYLWGVRTYCGLTLRGTGLLLGGMKPSAVDMAVKRWEARIQSDPDAADRTRALQARLSVLWNVEG